MSQAGSQDRSSSTGVGSETGGSPPGNLQTQVDSNDIASSGGGTSVTSLNAGNASSVQQIVSRHTKRSVAENQAYPHLAQDQRLDNRIWVTTPEQIRFRYNTVGAQRRFVAFGLDIIYMFGGLGLIIFAVWLLVLFIQYLLGTNLALQDLLEGISAFTIRVAIFVIYWFGTALQEFLWSGKTLGKMTVGIRVVSMDGRPPSLLQSFGRNFLRLADGLPAFPLVYLVPVGTPEEFTPESLMMPTFLIGLGSMMLTQRFQRVGDLFAGTMVVDHEKYQTANVPVFQDQALLSLALEIPRDFHPNRELLETLSLYVSRRVGFHEQRRIQMTSHLAKPLLMQWNMPTSINYDLLMGALYVRSVCEYSQVEAMLEESQRLSNLKRFSPANLQQIPATGTPNYHQPTESQPTNLVQGSPRFNNATTDSGTSPSPGHVGSTEAGPSTVSETSNGESK